MAALIQHLFLRIRVVLHFNMLLVFLAALGCGHSDRKGDEETAGGSSASGTVVVYSPHGQEMLDEYARAFEKAFPGIKVVGRFIPTGQILGQIRIDKDAPKADVWWGGTSAFFAQAAEEGLLQGYRPSWAAHSRPEHHDASDRWYAQFLSVPAILFNRNIHEGEEVPGNWEDLLERRWKGKLVFREPMDSGTMKTIFAGLVWHLGGSSGNPEPGFEYLRMLDSQTRAYLPNPQALYDRIAKSPEGYISLWNLTDIIFQSRANQYPFGYRIPEGPLPVSCDPIGILTNAPHLEEAKQFYEFVTSRENCLRLARDHYRILARTDIRPEESPDWMQGIVFEAMPMDLNRFDRLQVEWMDYWRRSIRDPEK